VFRGATGQISWFSKLLQFLDRSVMEKYTRLHTAIGRLTLPERQCLHLRAEGFRYREIAEILEVGVPTVGEYLRWGSRN
jgi:DNA-directed RNA polymerase specialized sigma24 family protein